MVRRTMQMCVAAVAVLVMVGSVNAALILFVDNETPDASWQTLIESGGHTYTLFDTGSYSISLSDQASIDYVEGFDAIVMSGSNSAFNAVRTHGAKWNTLSTPMINMGNYLASGQFSSASWRWTDETSKASNASDVSDVLDETDPVWNGVALTPGTPPTVDLFASNAGHLNLNGKNLLPGITAVAARSSNNDFIAIAHAEPDALRAGSQEQYLFAGMTGGSGNPVPFTAEGEQAFLNAIDALTGGGAPAQPGDFNLDTQVEQTDLNLLLANWGASTVPPEWTAAFDGLVDQSELNDLLANWGAGVAGAESLGAAETNVPEPATLGLLLLGGLAAIRRRQS